MYLQDTAVSIESVDSINRDGLNMSVYVIHNKNSKSSVQLHFQDV